MPRNAIEALFEINIDRVQASFRTAASLNETLQNAKAQDTPSRGAKPVFMLKEHMIHEPSESTYENVDKAFA